MKLLAALFLLACLASTAEAQVANPWANYEAFQYSYRPYSYSGYYRPYYAPVYRPYAPVYGVGYSSPYLYDDGEARALRGIQWELHRLNRKVRR